MRKLTIPSLPAVVAGARPARAHLPHPAGPPPPHTPPPATTIQDTGGLFFSRPTTKSTLKPAKVTFVFKNVGHVAHDFTINGKTTPLIQPGKTAKLLVTFKKTGKYPYLCTVPGHAAAGMKGVFTVR
jgi:uncharacterized cupredoxin-like copper-binding protein